MVNKLSANILIGFVVILLLCTSIRAQQADKSALEEKLRSAIVVTKTGFGDATRITAPGTVLIIRKDGINADLASDIGMLKNIVRDGQIVQPKGLFASMSSKKTTKPLRVGERVYVTKLNATGHTIEMWILTTEMSGIVHGGSTRQTRYKAVLDFDFPEVDLASADPAKIKAAIDAVLIAESDMAAADTKTVKLGQSTEEVRKILGAPEKTVDLGTKIVYIYKDMKIVFVDGRVSDVQ